jgi:hypothetical protein
VTLKPPFAGRLLGYSLSMLIAQAMGEYGGMSGLASAIQSGLNQAEAVIGGLSVKEYAVVVVLGGLMLFAFFRRRR